MRCICFFLAHGREPVDSVELDRFVSRHMHDGVSAKNYVKTHAASYQLQEFFPQTRNAVYVYRHPLDVLCSALDYSILIGEAGVDLSSAAELEAWKKAWIADYLESGAPPLWKDIHRTDSWNRNVESWLFDPLPFPVLGVAYEALLGQPRATIRTIAEFLSLDVDDELVAACERSTAFDRLRKMEDAEVEAAAEKGEPQGRFSVPARLPALQQGLRFFNRGRAGAHLDMLDPAVITRGEQVFGEVAARLGYSLVARSAAATAESQ